MSGSELQEDGKMKNLDCRAIGSFVEGRRRGRGISQADLAARAGITKSALSKIERGLTPRMSLATAAGLAYGLRVSVDMLAQAGNRPSVRSDREAVAALMFGKLPCNRQVDVCDIMEMWVDDGI